jgi:hypothetical protein
LWSGELVLIKPAKVLLFCTGADFQDSGFRIQEKLGGVLV